MSLPSLNALKEKVKELNSHYSIKATPNGTFGVQQSLRERLLLRVEHLLEHSSQDVFSGKMFLGAATGSPYIVFISTSGM